MGSALGVATVGTLGIAVYRGQISDSIPADPGRGGSGGSESAAGAVASIDTLPDHIGAALLSGAQEAFTDRLHVVAFVAAALLASIGVLVVTQLRHVPPLGDTAPQQQQPAAEGAPRVNEDELVAI